MVTLNQYRVAVLAGDGIGQEVVPAAIKVINKIASTRDFEIVWDYYPWGSSYYREHGTMMPRDALEILAPYEAIFFGAVGDPSISDVETLWGMLIPIRRQFEQYINLRPVRTLVGVDSVARCAIDLVIVRENSEGEYSSIGGRFGSGDAEFAVQEAIFTRRGIARAAEYAAKLALNRRRHVTSATKSNGIIHTMPFWDEVVHDTFGAYPELRVESVLIDALAGKVVLHPDQLDVVLASNLFGDILSDVAAAMAGSIGIAASANLNPERVYPSMFEPVHGSAPDIAGRGIANPVGQLWAGALMLDHLGESGAACELEEAFRGAIASGFCTADLGGSLSTSDFVEAVLGWAEKGSV